MVSKAAHSVILGPYSMSYSILQNQEPECLAGTKSDITSQAHPRKLSCQQGHSPKCSPTSPNDWYPNWGAVQTVSLISHSNPKSLCIWFCSIYTLNMVSVCPGKLGQTWAHQGNQSHSVANFLKWQLLTRQYRELCPKLLCCLVFQLFAALLHITI